MLLGRVLLNLRSTCSESVYLTLKRIFAVNEPSVWRLHSTSHRKNISALKPPAHRFGFKVIAQSCLFQLTVHDMQAASISYGTETTALALDDDDQEKEGGGVGDDEGVVGQDSEIEDEKSKNIIMSPGQVDAVSTEVHQEVAGTGAFSVSTPTVSNEKKTKRKIRREKRKLMKKKLKSSDTSDNLMSELPFALTSPTSWKELGFPNPKLSQKKRKRGDCGGRVDSEEDGDKKKIKKQSQRPNYFVSIPITNTQISSAVGEVQEVVLQQEPRLARAMIPIPTLHITLLVTHLASQEQVDLAASVLAQAEPSLAELLDGQDLVLPFSGIGHFRKEVVFVELAPGQHRHTLDSLAAEEPSSWLKDLLSF